jgi:cystathionine gamma-synthase
LHSATKYLNGHSDVVAGAVVAARESKVWDEMKRQRTMSGAVCSPFDAWLLLRGLRTLHVRVERQCATALRCFLYTGPHTTAFAW